MVSTLQASGLVSNLFKERRCTLKLSSLTTEPYTISFLYLLLSGSLITVIYIWIIFNYGIASTTISPSSKSHSCPDAVISEKIESCTTVNISSQSTTVMLSLPPLIPISVSTIPSTNPSTSSSSTTDSSLRSQTIE